MSNKAETMKKNKRTLTPKLRFPEFRDGSGWEETKLSQLGKLISGLTYSPEDVHDNGLLVLRSSNIKNGQIVLDNCVYVTPTVKGANLLIPNDILICVRNGSKPLIGKNAMIPDGIPKCTHGAFMTVLRTHSARFAFQLLQTSAFQKQVVADLGATINSINTGNLLKYRFFVPSEPLEQQKVAECLSSLDGLIAAEGRKLEALRDHKRGLMQQLFPQPGQTQPRLRFPEFRGEGGWKEFTLENVAKYRRGSFPQPYGLPEWYDDEKGMPFIQVFDVGDDLKLKPSTKRKISALAAEKSVFIKQGTVIITIQGSIGRVAVTQYDAYIDRTLLLIQRFRKPIEKHFFAYLIQILFEIEKQKAPGGIIKTITKEALSSFLVKLPSISEQKKVANCLTAIDTQIAEQAAKIESLKTHKRGLMQQLFPSPEIS